MISKIAKLFWQFMVWLGFKKPNFKVGQSIVLLKAERPYDSFFQVIHVKKDIYHYRYISGKGKYLGEGRSPIYLMDREYKSTAV